MTEIKKGSPERLPANSLSLSITSVLTDRQTALYCYKCISEWLRLLFSSYLRGMRPRHALNDPAGAWMPTSYSIQCLLIGFVVASSTAAIAQRCGATCASAESLLGSSEEALLVSIPELKRVPKPIPGPRNSRGKWVLSEIVFATQPYMVTYFVGAGQVTRIELLSTVPSQRCMERVPFELALSELTKIYGESRIFGSLEEGARLEKSVAFNTQSVDISLHFFASADDCSTRVIYKAREVKDASQL